MAASAGGIPDINDLVRVSLTLDDPQGEGQISDVPSRIEDLTRDPKTGQIVSYVIAAPRFVGDIVLPNPEAACSLHWHTPLGLWMLPTSFQAQETTGYGLRAWQLLITGPPRRDQRRRYVRVPWSLPTELQVRRDLAKLDPERRRLIEVSGVMAALPDLPEKLEARAVNVSEGGLLCMTGGPVLPTHLPLITRFTLDGTPFEIPAHVVWSVIRDQRADMGVENALAFDDPGMHGDVLRPLLFQAQLKARRAGLI
jgi:hypothetical protein